MLDLATFVELGQFNYFILGLVEVALLTTALLMQHDQVTIVQIELRHSLFVL